MPAYQSFIRKTGILAICAISVLSLSACASMNKAHSTNDDDVAVSDPLQPVNRVTLAFNEFLDKVFFNPLDTAYRTIVPKPGRDAVHNVLENVKSPVYLANELLQGDLQGAGTVTKRFVVNTIAGVGGIVDVAAKNGTPHQPEDFGQTLAVWGVGSGPYVVWPIFGPSTLRDSVGIVGDIAMDPLYWYAHNNDKTGLQWTRFGLTVVDTKDRYRDLQDDLRKNSGDYYTALQSVYMQRRNALINDLDPSKAALPTIE